MRKKMSLMLLMALFSLALNAQSPHHREEARKLTNQVDHKVGGLKRGQYDRVYHIQMQYVRHEIGIERRDNALRRVLTDYQWNRYRGHHRGPKAAPHRNAPRHRNTPSPQRNPQRYQRR